MKILKLLFIVLFLTFSFLCKAVNVDVWVVGDGCSIYQGNCYYGLQPVEIPYTFLPIYDNISGIDLSKYDVTYQWTKISGVVSTPVFLNTQRVTVKFTNVPNYNFGVASHQLKVKVTWTRKLGIPNPDLEPATYTKESTMRDIEVKYVSVPGPLNIGGSTYSNGNQHMHPCGTTPVTISVPAVTTENPIGANVTYLFTYPPGWTGPSSSYTPSVTVTPAANTDGVIKVVAKRIDSNYSSQISVTIKRIKPIINSVSIGNTLLCNTSQTISVSASGTSADKFVWTPSANVRVNGSPLAQTVSGPVNISAVGSGTVTVKAFSSACGESSSGSKIINVSFGPAIPPDYVYASSTYLCKNTEYTFHVIPIAGVTSYNWTWGQNTTLVSGQGQNAVVARVYNFGGTIPHYFGPTITVTNACGVSSAYTQTFTGIDCSGMPNELVVSPNPVEDVLILQIANKKMGMVLPDKVDIFSENSSTPVRTFTSQEISSSKDLGQGDKVRLDVSTLPKGIYFLHITNKTENDVNVSKIRVMLK